MTDHAENPNAQILALLAAKAERHVRMAEVLFGGPESQPAHELESEIEEHNTDE